MCDGIRERCLKNVSIVIQRALRRKKIGENFGGVSGSLGVILSWVIEYDTFNDECLDETMVRDVRKL